ncbi:MAG: hypothetical protein E7318_03375 [Clostridiales bacterium]|nr:hypothetical protein [Clostridiales bacterium]
MKYISRITALLLVLMMLTPTFASALTLDNATQSDLDKLYEEAVANLDGVSLDGLIGKTAPLAVSAQGAYGFQWYQIIANADGSVTEVPLVNETSASYNAVYQAETYAYYCKYLDASGVEQRTINYILEPTRDLYYYVAELSWGDDFLSETDVWNSEAMYVHMNTVWNVMLDGANLAESIVEYWWNDGDVYETEIGMLCSCVVSGAVQDSWCMLHPASDLHDDSCGWAKEEIMVSADVSTPDKLIALEGQNIVLTAPMAGADDYNWQYYTFNEVSGIWEWDSLEATGDTISLEVSTSTIQTGYRLVYVYWTDEGSYFIDTKPFYLGGYDFYNWIHTNEDIQAWMADASVTLADVVARYNEKDCVNADDYTYNGENGESLNLKVPEGAFDEPYIMEIEPTVPSAQTVAAVLQSMDATGTHKVQVLTAFDISFAALADRTNKLQPAEGTSVALTFQVNTAGIDEELKYLYVYHINDGTPEVVAGPIGVTNDVQPVEVQADGFSIYAVVLSSDSCAYCTEHDYCVYEELIGMGPDQQHEYLVDELDADERELVLNDYALHIAAGDPAVLCTCNQITVAPGSGHVDGCPWHLNYMVHTDVVGGIYEPSVSHLEGAKYKWFVDGEEIANETGNAIECTVTIEPHTYECHVMLPGQTTPVVYTYYVVAQTTAFEQYVSMLATEYDYVWAEYGMFEEYADCAFEYMSETWNLTITPEDGSAEYNLAEAVLSYWYQTTEPNTWLYSELLCSCVANGKADSEYCVLPYGDLRHAVDCQWYTGSPLVSLAAETDDNGDTYYVLYMYLKDEYGFFTEEIEVIATSVLMQKDENSKAYHYFQDINTDWYVAYLHEEINDDGTVTQWIIPLPSEKDLEETPAN